MSLSQLRNCPLCGSSAIGVTFPYGTLFNSIRFSYVKCGECASVFVDPVPDDQTFAKMYAKAEYHDCHYKCLEGGAYADSAELLRQYVPAGASVVDYGCGVGAFLKALRFEGFEPYGVEFDSEAAGRASESSGCIAMSVEDFEAQRIKPKFDVVHFGDVLEHLADPAHTLAALLGNLKPGGALFVEGPLETNPSPVYWSARLFGAIKRLIRPKFIACDAPTHLFRTGEKQQKDFFLRVEPSLKLKHWQIYETGWPYASGGVVKRAISALAVVIGGRRFFGSTFGNRFRAVFVLQAPSRTLDEPGNDA